MPRLRARDTLTRIDRHARDLARQIQPTIRTRRGAILRLVRPRHARRAIPTPHTRIARKPAVAQTRRARRTPPRRHAPRRTG